jgi:4-amino-4-deoxy-L-arabinose transferase-like glycosyltransferase
MRLLSKANGLYLVALLLTNLTLLLPNAHPLRVAGAMLLLTLLPGLSWSDRFFSRNGPMVRWTIAAGLSVAMTTLCTLLLHYLPGPIHPWQLLLALNLPALLPLGFTPRRVVIQTVALREPLKRHASLLLILLTALFLRGANLAYSEFQGDEALAMIIAAEAAEGHADALFLRSKGPAEVLLPLAVWRLTGAITEPIARLPFTLAALWAIVAIYLIGRHIGGTRLGWLAAGFLAMNGFMVAFGRIVQYQALVLWFSSMAVLLAFQWRYSGQYRHIALAGLFLGVGLLAHYDAILTVPAIGWFLLVSSFRPIAPQEKAGPGRFLRTVGLFALTFLLAALPFYLPFTLDPRADRTGSYLGHRIGSELRNNLPDFLHFNTFYSSAYFIIFTGLLVLAFLSWVLWRTGWPGRVIGGLCLGGGLLVLLNPAALVTASANLSLAPFAVLLLTALLALVLAGFFPHRNTRPWNTPISTEGNIALYPQVLVIWLAVPFLGYNFVVALGLTHIYTVIPAWSLLAALGWSLLDRPLRRMAGNRPQFNPANVLLGGLFALSALFLANAFVRHDVEYWQDYPAGNLPIFWDPYDAPPQAGFFGFAHRAGWKAVGQLMADGTLSGDYGSNEEPDVTAWYTRGAPRACDPRPEFYYLADDLIDPVEIPLDIIAADYQPVGQVGLANGKHMDLHQQTPTRLTLPQPDEATLAAQFDATATTAAFARSARGSRPAEANFGHRVRLIGYDLDTRRAYPGGRVPVTLYWQALAPIEISYQVFTHLEGETGPAAQADGVPVCWSYPTDAWRPGQIIADQHAIPLPPELTPGDYRLEIGLYEPDTFARLDVLDIAGNPAGTSLLLDTVTVMVNGE